MASPASRLAGDVGGQLVNLPLTAANLLFDLGMIYILSTLLVMRRERQVQVWLGHHSAAFTMATYVHLLADDLPDSPFGQLHADRSKDAPESTDRTDRLHAAGRTQG
jgi:hypothetical protein